MRTEKSTDRDSSNLEPEHRSPSNFVFFLYSLVALCVPAFGTVLFLRGLAFVADVEWTEIGGMVSVFFGTIAGLICLALVVTIWHDVRVAEKN